MSFKVSIESSGVVLEKCIRSVSFIADPPNDIDDMETYVASTILISGDIGPSESADELYKWSQIPANDDNCYKKIVVETIGARDQVIRKITFSDAFVVDYTEGFANNKGFGVFKLKIRQKADLVIDINDSVSGGDSKPAASVPIVEDVAAPVAPVVSKVACKVTEPYNEFSKISDPKERYEYLLNKAKTMDVSTEKNKSIFYAGRITTKIGTITARQMAERFAEKILKKRGIVMLTLERTPGGKWMDDLKLYEKLPSGKFKYEELGLLKDQVDELWNTLSSRYADGASGVVTAFAKNVPEPIKPKTVFWSTEINRLNSNSKVTSINIK